ncbi:MAG: sulfurtransferase TusA family protein [Actinobacteria bacterium]|nr:sulfurtransferase TusA family protein [Actinomycetota bacterium]MBU4302408.1 sulfurtransferase TusA family protein [Actinomycetota bacterium]MBU4489754.1 sulfurtransferase TusA family protein [Actinomycetota bacterium]MCG2795327.1 sulfurtransferase TusA family protein [Actinomycetes bacterium]
MDADHTLDCIGLYCPMPIVKTSQRIKELAGGEVLEVVSDDRGIKSDMPAWCEKTGHEFLGLQEDEGEIKVYVRKSPATE